MLKFGVTFLMLFVVTSSVYSQGNNELSDIQQRFQRRKIISKYEIVAGGGLLRNSGYLLEYYKPKFGYSVGLGAYHTFSRTFDLNIRTTYDLKGSNVEQVSSSSAAMTSKSTVTANLYYFTFTLLPTFKIGPRKRFSLGGGFYYSLLSNGKVTKKDLMSNGQVVTTSVYGREAFDTQTDRGICAFAGYSFQWTKKNAGAVQFFFNRSIDDVADAIDGYQRHKSFMLMFSYQIAN